MLHHTPLALALSVPLFWVEGALALAQDGDTDKPTLASSADSSFLTFGASYVGDVAGVVAGGAKRELVFLERVDLTLTTDLYRLIGWQGATLSVNGMGTQGGSPSEGAGDAQVLSNIDADDTWKLYQLLLDYDLLDERLSFRAGLYDINSEFDVIETASLFINSSHGIGVDFAQSGANGPSIFPSTSLGLRARLRPSRSVYVQAAVLDGVAGDPGNPSGTRVELASDDGALITAEIGYRRDEGRLKVALGGWAYTAEFADLEAMDATSAEPLARRNNGGVYALADVAVTAEASDAKQGLAVFARYGLATTDVNRFGQYVGLGAVYTGPFPRRNGDRLGLAMATAVNGAKYRRISGGERAEISLELAYKLTIASWLWLEPDVQYIVNPNTDPSSSNALVLLLRAEVALEAVQ